MLALHILWYARTCLHFSLAPASFLPFSPSVSRMEAMMASAPQQCATCLSVCHPPDLLLHPLPCHLFLCPHPIQNSPRVTKSPPPFRCILGGTFFRKASWPDGLMASPHFRGPEPRTSELAHSSSNASSLKSACGSDCELFKCRRCASSLRDSSSNVFVL